MKDIFKKLIKEFHENTLPEVVHRDITIEDSEEIITLIGLRRVGKTYLLFQKIIELMESGVKKENIIFINFEDERIFDIKTEQLDELFEAYYELYPENIDAKIYLFFDEIQSAPQWSLFLKRIYEKKKYRIFVTGSSSKLLSSEIATELRGRSITKYIYTLSFKEFLRFRNYILDDDISHSKKRFLLKKELREFLEYGGYPLVAKQSNNIEKESTLSSYIELMIYRDLVERYRIRNTLLLKNLIKYIVTSVSKNISLNKFYESAKKELNISKDAVSEYFGYLEDIKFLFILNKYSDSIKKQFDSTKKVYIADNGFKKIYGFNIAEDNGRLLENMVFLELKRRYVNIFYHTNAVECDFIIKEGSRITKAIQVCYELNEDNKDREIKGLLEAMARFKLKEGIIITFDQEKTIKEKDIKVIPVWKWLLTNSKL